jgi:glycosyltransferase involved in cell wall biosynthesis
LSALKTIDDFNPDVIYLNSFFSKTTQLVFFLNYIKYNKKIVIAPRGELQDNALKIKRIKKYTYLFLYKFLQIQKNVHFHSTDIIETKSIKKLLNVNNVTEISNVAKIHKFKPLTKKTHELKIIFVSRISKKKNLLFALECLKSIKHDIVFDIYGPKEDVDYWNQCQDAINRLPANIEVKYKGELDQKKVIPIMRKYNVFLLPTRSENFGHVIVEAMQAGLIPIISDQTPWVGLQDVSIGWSIPLNRKVDYIKAIDSLCEINSKDYTDKSSRTMSYIHTKIDIKLIAEKYLNFFYNINT